MVACSQLDRDDIFDQFQPVVCGVEDLEVDGESLKNRRVFTEYGCNGRQDRLELRQEGRIRRWAEL